jgi:WD40 repeat protein
VKLGSMDAIQLKFHGIEGVLWVCLSPTDDRKLAIVGLDGWIEVWDVNSGKMIKTIEGCANIAEFSPTGHAIATTDCGNDWLDLKLVNPESGEVLCTMVGHTKEVLTACWSVSEPQPFNRRPQALNPKPQTLIPEPKKINPKSLTL